MDNLTMNEFRRQVGEYINQTYYADKIFVLTKGQKKVAALVPIAMLTRLEELEEFYERTKTDAHTTDTSTNSDSQTTTISEQ